MAVSVVVVSCFPVSGVKLDQILQISAGKDKYNVHTVE